MGGLSMTPPNCSPTYIRFEGFELDLRTGELLRSGRKLRLPNQSFRVLAMLLERPGQLVTREELRANLWPAGTFVEYDQGLNVAVNRLREALRDSAEKPRFIETLPKRGYRFIGVIQPQVTEEDSTQGVQGPAETLSPAPGIEATAAPESGLPVPSTQQVPGVSAARDPTKARAVMWWAAAGVLCAIVAITGAIFSLDHRSVSNTPPAREVIPFTSLPGQEVAPAFSPDGSQVAFAWNGETNDASAFDLYVKAVGSERLLRLTNKPSRVLVPAWSPDGGSIAFVRIMSGDTGIFVIPALGGLERRVVSGNVGQSHLSRISWSPDAKRLAYSGYGPQGGERIYVLSMASLKIEPLSPAPDCLDAIEPAFSPNGTQLALVCLSSSKVYGIYVVDVPNGPVRRLTSVMGDPQGLTWSADGKRIVFSNDIGRGGELWELTLDGRQTQLPFGENGSTPAVAATGSRMAYVRSQNTTNIWRMDLAAVHPETSAVKLIYSTRAQGNPRYSADGAHIAFQSNRSGSTEIWLTDGSGNEPLRLTSFNGAWTDTPSWCSDGRRIAFDSTASGDSAIYVEDIGERVPRKVATSQANLSRPLWSRDCRWLFASDGKYRFYRFPAAGGAAERFTDRASYYAVAVGDRVIFNAADANGITLWSKPAAGGAQEALEQIPRLTFSEAWTANSIGIYYTRSVGAQVSLNLYDFASRTTRTILTLQSGPVPGGGPGVELSADGRWLLYTRVDDLQSDIMLVPGM